MIKITECDDQHLIDRNEKTYTTVNTKGVDFFYKIFIHNMYLTNKPLNTMEKINTLFTWNFSKKIRDVAVLATIALTLSGCWSKEENFEKQVKKVQQLEYELKQQAENYRYVATQQNIQQDLKEWWADATINKEIWYSLDRAEEQDEKIAKTKEKLSEAQKELARMKEEMGNTEQINDNKLKKRLRIDKYDYIPKEFKRSGKSK